MIKALASLASLALMCVASSLLAEDIVLFDANTKTDLLKSKHLRGKNNEIITTLTSIILEGDFNLDKNRDIAIDLENPTSDFLALNLWTLDDPTRKDRETNRVMRTIVPANFKGRVILEALKPLKCPSILKKMKAMRNDPFGRCDRNMESDMTKIKRVRIQTYQSSADNGQIPPVVITKITALDTSKQKLPSWYYIDEKDFFPFIDKYGQFKFKEWKNKIHTDADFQKHKEIEAKDLAAHISPNDWNKYGGWATGPKFKATGRFYVKKHEGKWWLIDPEGCLYWSHGVVRVTPSSAITPLDNREFYFENLPSKDDEFALFYTTKDELLAPYYTVRGWKKTYDFSAANIFRKYGKNWREEYASLAHKRLRSWGMNTIANSSDSFIYKQNKTPYIERLETRGPTITGTLGSWWPICDPFDEEFQNYFRNLLQKKKSELTSPYCIGLFVDNEHHWGAPEFVAQCTLSSPSSLKAKQIFVSDLKQKYGEISALNKAWKTNYKTWQDILESTSIPKTAKKADLREFSAKLIEKYFKTIRDEIKRLDPQLLYMGCRFSGFNPMIVRIADKYCDGISYNTYRYRIDNIKLPEGVDKPIMLGEFHFGAISDTGKFNPSLVFTTNQDMRAQCYKRYLRDALEHKNIIGTHWHQFADQATTGRFDGENFQVGFTDMCDTPYEETIKALREVGYNLYKTRFEHKK